MPERRRFFCRFGALAFAAMLPAGTASGEASPGVTEDRILFGQSAAFSGPAGELGTSMQMGILAAFREANERGGIAGRRLELQSLDDAYEPEAAIANTRQLIERGVFALIGAVGTPTSKAAVPVAEEEGVPYLAPMTGAEYLRDRMHQLVVNLRASYYQEAEEMVKRLTEDLGVERIAIVYQDDSFGHAGFHSVRRALNRRGMSFFGMGVFPRNTLAVKTALLDIRGHDPEAVIIIGPYKPAAMLIKWARHLGMHPVFMALSFVGSNALKAELGTIGTGILVTQVVPFPTGDAMRASAQYRAALKAHDPDAVPGFVSFEGYLAGRLVAHAVGQCGAQVDRHCLLAALQTGGAIDLDGFVLNYGSGDNQGSDRVFLTAIGQDGEFVPVSALTDVPGLVARLIEQRRAR